MAPGLTIAEVCSELDDALVTLWQMPASELPEDLIDRIQSHTSRLRMVSEAFLEPDAGRNGARQNSRSAEPDPHDLFALISEQVRMKDEQLRAKDEQIAGLQRHSEDLVSAIRHWQTRALPPHRGGVGWWRRLLQPLSTRP